MQTEIIQEGNWLTVAFEQPHKVLSWAVLNGGMRQSRQFAWYRVEDQEIGRDVNPGLFLQEKLKQKGLEEAVGLLTSAELETFIDIEKDFCQNLARCIATVGMTNALRVGDLPGSADHIGTINLIVQLSTALSDEAMVEAISIAAEARTAAILDSQYPSSHSGLPATGTGTDCIGIAAPITDLESQRKYAGKHTDVGYLIGAVVYEVIHQGVERWKKSNGA